MKGKEEKKREELNRAKEKKERERVAIHMKGGSADRRSNAEVYMRHSGERRTRER